MEKNMNVFTHLPITHPTTSYDRIEKPDEHGRFGLHYACMNRDTTVGQIERILATNRRARRYRDINNKLPLNYAVELGPDANEAIIELLLMHYLDGAQNMCYEFNRTLLHKALQLGCSEEIIEILIHAYPEQTTMKTLNSEHLPIHYCILYHSTYDTLRLVYEAYPKALQEVDYLGRVALHIAVRNHSPANIVNYLVRRHPDGMRELDKIGNTPFLVGCECGCFLPILRLLFEAWPFCIHTSDFEGWTPLHKACKNGYHTIVSFLLHVGAYTDTLTHSGIKPFNAIGEPRHHIPGAKDLNKGILNTITMLSGIKKIWRLRNHKYFPPQFRASVETLMMIGNRLGDEFPWQKICKYLPRTWFDTPAILERQKQLQPHLFVDRYKLEMQRKEQARLAAIKNGEEADIFSKRIRMRRIMKVLHKYSVDISTLTLKEASKRTIMKLMGGTDTSDSEAIIRQMEDERNRQKEILVRAKRELKKQELALRQKMINRGLKVMAEEEHIYDVMMKGVEEKNEDWYDYLQYGWGVDELFYEQLLRDDKRIFKDFRETLEELPSVNDEEKDARNALEDANNLLITQAEELQDGMKDVLLQEDLQWEQYKKEIDFVRMLQTEEAVRLDVQTRRRREEQWKKMRRKLKKSKKEEKSVNGSDDDEDDDWSFATDDVVSIGSSVAEGLSSEELMFFKRLEYELREIDDDLEDEMDGVHDYKSRAGSRGSDGRYGFGSRGSDRFSLGSEDDLRNWEE